MSDEPIAHSNKKTYLLAAAGALVFLLILPGIVLAIASIISGVELISAHDADGVPDYDVFRTLDRRGAKRFWIRAQEGATPNDAAAIANHLVRIEKKSMSSARFFFFVELDPETKAFKEPITDNIDYTLVWNQEDGVKLHFDRSIHGSGAEPRRPSAPPSLRGFNPRRR